MKTNKFWSIMVMLVLALFSALSLTSCGDDEEDIVEQSTMVGKWKYSWDKGCYGLLTFKSNGTGTYFEYDDGEIDADNEPFYWSYDEKGSILTILWEEDGQVVEKEVVHLTWINNKKFMADDLMDSGSVWVKQ